MRERDDEGMKVSYLLFTDDTLVCCEASQDHRLMLVT